MTSADSGWSSNRESFSFKPSTNDIQVLLKRPRYISRTYLILIAIFAPIGMYLAFTQKFPIPGGVILGHMIGLASIAPAILSVPLVRRLVLGKFARDISTRIAAEMGENEDFAISLRQFIQKTTWFKYTPKDADGHLLSESVPLCLPSGKLWFLDFEKDYSRITFRRARR